MSLYTLTLTLLFLKMHSFADLGEVSGTDCPLAIITGMANLVEQHIAFLSATWL